MRKLKKSFELFTFGQDFDIIYRKCSYKKVRTVRLKVGVMSILIAFDLINMLFDDALIVW